MALGDEFKSSGITENTPKNILLGAGTIHKGLTWDSTTSKWNFEDSLLCATSGGSKVTIQPVFADIDIDGANVKAKGISTQKTGETAVFEINPAEITPEILKMSLIGTEETSTSMQGYSEFHSKARVEEGDYLEHMGFVGKKLDGSPIIIIFDNALCTSGLELETKSKEMAVPKFTFECYADLSPDLDTLPYHIYYPTPTTTAPTEPVE